MSTPDAVVPITAPVEQPPVPADPPAVADAVADAIADAIAAEPAAVAPMAQPESQIETDHILASTSFQQIDAVVYASDAPALLRKPQRQPKAAKIGRPVKQRVSDETLSSWQATLAAEQAAKEAARERKLSSSQAARERATAFNRLRAMMRNADVASDEPCLDDELAALRDDRLARTVHEAPAHVRTIIEATLGLLVGKRRGRPPKR